MLIEEKQEKEESNSKTEDNPLKKVVTVPPLTSLKYANDQSKETSTFEKGEKRNGA